MSFLGVWCGIVAAAAKQEQGGGDPPPPGSPTNLTVTNQGGNPFGLSWTNGVSSFTSVFRDGTEALFVQVGPGVSSVDIGPSVGDGFHTWIVRHDVNGNFSNEVATQDGVAVSGPGPTGAPSGLTVYEYGGGENYGVTWGNADSLAHTELEIWDVAVGNFLIGTDEISPGGNTSDQGSKADGGIRAFRARHKRNNQYSDWSEELHTISGVPQ